VYEISPEVDPLLVPGQLPGHFYYQTATANSIARCHDTCKSHPNCASWTYDAATNSCRFADRYARDRVVPAAGFQTHGGVINTPARTPLLPLSASAALTGSSDQLQRGSIDPATAIAVLKRGDAKTIFDCHAQCAGNIDCTTYSFNGNKRSDRCRLFSGGTPERRHGKNYYTYKGRVHASPS